MPCSRPTHPPLHVWHAPLTPVLTPQCEMKDVYPPDDFQDEAKYRDEKYRAPPDRPPAASKAAFQDELKKSVNK